MDSGPVIVVDPRSTLTMGRLFASRVDRLADQHRRLLRSSAGRIAAGEFIDFTGPRNIDTVAAVRALLSYLVGPAGLRWHRDGTMPHAEDLAGAQAIICAYLEIDELETVEDVVLRGRRDGQTVGGARISQSAQARSGWGIVLPSGQRSPRRRRT